MSLVDENREWFKSCVGVPAREGARDTSFCGHTILERDTLVISDAAADERFADNPQVVEDGIRFYAGHPLQTPEGERVGAFCIKDRRPRRLRADQLRTPLNSVIGFATILTWPHDPTQYNRPARRCYQALTGPTRQPRRVVRSRTDRRSEPRGAGRRRRESVSKRTRRHIVVEAALEASDRQTDSDIRDRDASIDEIWAEARRVTGLSDEAIAAALAERCGLSVADLEQVDAHSLRLVPEKVAHQRCLCPLRETSRHLTVAISDPGDMLAEEEVRFSSGRRPILTVAPPSAVRAAIQVHYRPDSVIQDLLDNLDIGTDGIQVIEADLPEEVAAAEASVGPVVALTNLILREAAYQGASDVHLEPGRSVGAIRYRLDGILHLRMRIPMRAFRRVVSRVKILASMNIAERFQPLDGRALIRTQKTVIDLRISTVPTQGAEKMVIRLLPRSTAETFETLGLPQREMVRFRRILTRRDRIVCVTGPTGCGKSSTLYAAIRELATGDVNIMTVEDPVEYQLEGITQMQVDMKRHVTFASALRAILRQDPDIILVGEIRDPETAEIALQAAQTGHLVLSTAHTSDALGLLSRLEELGLKRAALAESLGGAIAQRLLRRVCPVCAKPITSALDEATARLAANYGVTPRVRAVGCPQCSHTGYRGRIPILETVVVGPELATLIGSGAPIATLAEEAARGGTVALEEGARVLIEAGHTTLDEVHRVLGEAVEERTPAPPTPLAPPPRPEPRDDAEGAPRGPFHLLVADDDPIVRAIARAVLEESGFVVSEAIDGQDAIDRLDADEEIDIVVLDLQMPKQTGLEVVRHARHSPRTAGLPIVVLTSDEGADTEATLLDAGADDYVRKPIEPNAFLASVKSVLRRTGR